MKINGVIYEIRELSMEDGFALLNENDGALDIPSLVRASVLIDGQPAGEGDISFGVAQKLMADILRINGLEATEGNG